MLNVEQSNVAVEEPTEEELFEDWQKEYEEYLYQERRAEFLPQKPIRASQSQTQLQEF
jgi:hypothetical protein